MQCTMDNIEQLLDCFIPMHNAFLKQMLKAGPLAIFTWLAPSLKSVNLIKWARSYLSHLSEIHWYFCYQSRLGSLFLCCKDDIILCLTPEELGHLQHLTPIHWDNSTVVGIANNTIKKQSRSIKMHYVWVSKLVKRKEFDIHWHPGVENLGNYTSKHHVSAHHHL